MSEKQNFLFTELFNPKNWSMGIVNHIDRVSDAIRNQPEIDFPKFFKGDLVVYDNGDRFMITIYRGRGFTNFKDEHLTLLERGFTDGLTKIEMTPESAGEFQFTDDTIANLQTEIYRAQQKGATHIEFSNDDDEPLTATCYFYRLQTLDEANNVATAALHFNMWKEVTNKKWKEVAKI